MTRFLTPLALAALLAGCGDSGPEPEAGGAPESAPEPTSASAEANPFLSDIDAGTAYVYANLQRLPEAINEKQWAVNEAGAGSNQAVLDALTQDEEMPAEARMLMEQILGLTTREGWEAAGLHPNPFYAIYAEQLMPFVRFELSDADKFEAFVTRMEAGLEQPLTRRDVEGEQIIWFEIQPGLGIALYHDEQAATVAVIPDDAAFLARAAGAFDPVEPMTAAALNRFNEEQGFNAFGSGYLSWQRFIDDMLAEDAPLAALYTESQLDDLRANPACVAEYGALGEAMPRLSMGYTRTTEQQMDFLVRQELSQPLADALRPAAQSPVGIDRELSGLFNFGLSFDLVAAREFARMLVDGWVENPPECPSFAAIGAQAPELQENLARPIPPVVTNLQGMYLEAMTFDLGENGTPTGGGTLSFFMKNPELLVGMAQMFSPAVAAIELTPGGEPQPIPANALPQLEQLGLKGWLAMSDNAIGMAIGEDHVEDLKRAIAPTESDDLLMAGSLDFSMLSELMTMAEDAVGDLDEGAAAGLKMQRAQYEALAEIYDSAAFKIRLANGIEFIAESRLK